MSRLVVVSNRVPDPDRPPQGGLAVAVQAALKERGGIWMGWSGRTSGTKEPGPLTIREEGAITYALSDLSDQDLAEYYAGLANSVLWPLCHYRIDLTDYARRDMAGYLRVNRLFAERLRPLIRADDVIWIHDYHLLPLAAELRQMGVANRIGFFMHIPWPSPDVFFTLPVQAALLTAMTAFDLIGFQTEDDAENFALCLRRGGVANPVEGKPGLLDNPLRRFRVGAFPIGIDVSSFSSAVPSASISSTIKRFQQSLEGRDLIVGVDRLDYTKGIPERLRGFRRFLEVNPAWHGRITMLQITPKSRSDVAEYDALQHEVAEIAGHINGAMGRLDWTPVRYVNRAFGQQLLSAVYRMAKVGLVTPLRDGMNLVAKEYVAAQDPEDPGVLVLSRFAGAAHELGEGALLVNPYDVETIADALARAASMPLEQRRQRYQAMMEAVTTNDVFHWCRHYLDQLSGSPPDP
ncbi:alpha,alpha-trehalose-phosphate synthase (UDP-forming) [Brucella pseudogrignonensis]|uniref:alpha,alpha-trehalose-phosphate synthase (UDP-forming) n=1 Tax=Brucella pseudogrignonensis TaxID=419475 RepID=UPI0003488B87|nr:alpha,alpha-trehalose-phosphate synthase (UDP-forming) [Brucella pseudogrignonensis]ANG99558.1 alpha,alpha-trehalose-phosphate synthase (UDP-forming) [Brucella pseudogrignonensis]